VEMLNREMFPGVLVVPMMSYGSTDARYLRNGDIATYGIDGTFSDLEDVRAHGKDERLGVKQFFEGLGFQYRLIKILAGP
jgi:acetylornithine deacetylase/succinyl-diaminopimelate desuccinylase-like protein